MMVGDVRVFLVSVRAEKLELAPAELPLPSPFLGHLAIRCSVLLQIRHFMISPFRSLGFPCRPKPFPDDPFLCPLPLDDRKVNTGSVNQKPFPRLNREYPFPLPLDFLNLRLNLRTGRPVRRLQFRLAFRY